MRTMTGVESYAVGTVTITQGFPNGERQCKWCSFCRDDAAMRQRRRCILSEEILYDINIIGTRCPMVFEEKGEENG